MSVYPAALWRPGPPELAWPEPNRRLGAILHSAEGHWSPAYTPVDTMRERVVSWPFTVMQDGRVEQHYDTAVSCWHAGNREANGRLIGIEHEGVTGEPLTPAQTAASVALVRWLAQECGWRPERASGPAQTLWEHHEVTPTTDCPSGRIPWERYVEQPIELDPVVNADEITLIVELLRQLAVEGSGVTVKKVRASDPAEYRIWIA